MRPVPFLLLKASLTTTKKKNDRFNSKNAKCSELPWHLNDVPDWMAWQWPLCLSYWPSEIE